MGIQILIRISLEILKQQLLKKEPVVYDIQQNFSVNTKDMK